jgi:hypothetical protein
MKGLVTYPAILCLAAMALAREPDGTLSTVLTPNNGRPSIVTPGATFEVVLTEKAQLELASEAGTVSLLAVDWDQMPGGRMKARCTLPTNVHPGPYALHATIGDRMDRNVRSVFVRESFPEHYAVAHITDTDIGSRRDEPPSEAIFRDIIRAVNNSRAAFVLVTGDLTEGGTPDQFTKFIEILDLCELPTFVCPGDSDLRGGLYEKVFGPTEYLFRFGADGYLSFSMHGPDGADDYTTRIADLELFRRAIKPARWSIGFTHRYDPSMDMRSQLILFVDDPLDHLVFGHWRRANREGEKTVAWGTTSIAVTPAASDGALRIIDVSPVGIHHRPAQYVADVE